MKKFSTVLITTAILTSTFAADAQADTITKKSLGEVNISTQTQAKKLLENLPGKFEIEKYSDQFHVQKVETDNKGYKHYTLIPKYNNVKALNREVKVHIDNNGKVVLVNGELNKPSLQPKNNVTLTQQQALIKAFAAVGIKQSLASNPNGVNPVLKNELSINADKQLYVYDIRISTANPVVSHWSIQVDAATGNIVEKNDLLSHVTAGRGIGNDGAFKPLLLEQQSNGTFGLRNKKNNTTIETFDGLHTNRVDRILMTDTDKIFRDANQKSGVDAHFYINKVYDYYNKVHGRDSFDNYGKTILNVVHHRTDYNNAFWNGTAMYYGDGDGIEFNPLAGSLDIVAHEFTHAITDAEAGLVYQNQPGAISEHLSDAFAYFIEPDWQIGEKVYTPGTKGDALRNIKDPSISIPSQPDHMRFFLYLPNTADGDKGGVHYNSGILNKALYNLIDEEDMPVNKVEQIYYLALCNYLTSTAKFVDLKQTLVRSARDLYTEEDAQKVKRAFDNVGIEDPI